MVEARYQNAFTEVYEILKFTEEDLIQKLPQSVKDFVAENKSKYYITNITPDKSLEEQTLLPETEAILSLFYRSYWATEEEKEEFSKKDEIELRELEEKRQQMYSTDIFKDRNKNIKIEENVEIMLVSEKTPWYQKIWNKICNIFRKKS